MGTWISDTQSPKYWKFTGMKTSILTYKIRIFIIIKKKENNINKST